jgi:DNA/RNA endonuclease YhcR with UshA esterase domain
VRPVVVAPHEGAEVRADFRFSLFPGSIAGTLRRESDGLIAAGIAVALFRGTATTGDPLAATVTGTQGQFSFEGLRPGEYTLVFQPFPTMQLVGGNTRTLTVSAAGSAAADVRFTGNVLLPIADAKQAELGETVAVEGTVTVAQGMFNAASMYIQDASGGIQVFNVPTSVGAQIGDRVTVVGLMGQFGGELQIVRFAVGSDVIVTKTGTAAVPAPREVSGAQLAARAFEGQLGVVRGAEFLGPIPTGTSSYNLPFRAADGTLFQVRIETPRVAEIPRTFWTVGARYDVIGVIGFNNGTIQIKPRTAGDVVRSAGPMTISEAKARPQGDTILIEGIATVNQGPLGAFSIYIQDASGGIQVFGLPGSAAVQLGDRVQIRGLLGAFGGELQVTRFSSTDSTQVTKLGTAAVPAPRELTGEQIAARTFEGQLAVTRNAVFSGTIPTGTSSYNLNFTAADGTPFQVRVETPLAQSTVPRTLWEVGATYDITGLLAHNNGNNQIKVRGPADVVRR